MKKHLHTEDETADADDIKEAIDLAIEYEGAAPDPADYGVWVPGIPVLIGDGLDAIGCADWLEGLILDGIVAGVGAVLGFVPQMLVLFLLLAILGSMRIHGTYRIYHGQNFQKIRSFRKIIYSDSCRYRLWCSWYHGFSYNRE